MLCPTNELPTNDLRSKCAGEISRRVTKGCLFDKAKEKEANFLAAELLVPYEAALKATFGEKTNDEIAVAYGVSTQFAQMRMAGVRKHAARALAKQARSRRPW
jgi:Zn-dependent peptidase ImmA (M78 family)